MAEFIALSRLITDRVTDGTYLFAATRGESLCHIPTASLIVTFVCSEGRNLPPQIFLSADYPHPFNITTAIQYKLPAAGHGSLKIYSLPGHVVLGIADKIEEAGIKQTQGDPSTFPSGIYFCRSDTVDVIDPGKTSISIKEILFIK